MDAIPLQSTTTNGNHGPAPNDPGTAFNGASVTHVNPEETERHLLSERPDGCNGDASHPEELPRDQEMSCLCKKKEQLNKKVCSRVRLWMVIVLIIVLIVGVVLISLFLCSAIHQDKDEIYDSSLFKVPRSFNGRFQLPNLKLYTLSSSESQTLAADLQAKITDLYTSSHALGRYVPKAEIFAFRNGSDIADFQLTFLMPEEQQDQLRNFTLSREMVYNVFRQFLYDQETDESKQMYINPVSLNMVLRD